MFCLKGYGLGYLVGFWWDRKRKKKEEKQLKKLKKTSTNMASGMEWRGSKMLVRHVGVF